MSHEAIPFDTVRKRVNRPMAAENRRPVPAWGREPNGTLWIRCTCGLPITLDVPATHTVAPDGTVSPSVWHDDCPTGRHTFVRLQNWPGDK